jgi:CheY-like chemotaxis protein
MDKKRILVVDDEPGFTRLLKLTLEATGNYTVYAETDGMRGLEVAREFKPDLIFLDVVMPMIDGGDIASQIKSDPVLKDVPIVFLTALVSQKEDSSLGLIAGFPFMAKPVTLDSLIQCIEETPVSCSTSKVLVGESL